MTTARPRIIMPVARVATKGLIWNPATSSPLKRPSAVATRSAISMPVVGSVTLAILAAMTPARAKMAPAERSKPPAMMTRVAAQAMMPTGADWSRMLNRLRVVRKAGEAMLRATKSTTKVRSTA
jgi:hypothetical protein